MVHDIRSTTPPEVPADLIAAHRAGWNAFTQATAITCVLVTLVVLAIIVFAKII